ncbi:ribonuclease H-like domain-containing protein [Rufibacter sediminis]|uniref:Ribonuclease H n=1 Tax=Rufibacter sediminis TaxID=2762756 RepID=A0ABR6VV15_9BACT|nr:ribonuclease H [Rufibacter sediminis]MBC3540638.1 ribonuclease H [Rufibacter sediminis]
MALIPPKPIRIAHHIFLDIETIPTQDKRIRNFIAESVKPPGNMKKAETIAEWEKNEKPAAIEKALEQASLDGAYNNIVCIGAAANNSEPVSFMGKEKEILSELYAWLGERVSAGTIYVGHNIVGFDLKNIRQRSMILGIKPPHFMPFNTKPWDANPFDTMVQWDSRNFVSMDKIAMALGIRGKTGNGSEVYAMWKAEMFDAIADYCKADVELVRKIYNRMTFADAA